MNWVSIKKQLKKFSRSAWTPFAAIPIALGIGAILLLLAGYNPLEAYQAMWQGAFKDRTAIT